jgi:transcription elongation factor GreA
MIKKPFRMTQAGADELRAELDELIAARPLMAERIKTAREFGDLSENAEYQSARGDQDKSEARIAELEHILQNVEIIQEPKSSASAKVQLGSKVTLKSNGKTKVFMIVGTVEANPMEGKISDESPIGKSLLGKKEDDEVEIQTPAETATYKITDIS